MLFLFYSLSSRDISYLYQPIVAIIGHTFLCSTVQWFLDWDNFNLSVRTCSLSSHFDTLFFCQTNSGFPLENPCQKTKAGKRYSCWKHWKSSNLISLSLYTFITCAQLSVDVLKSDDIESKLKGYVSQAFLTTSSSMYEKRLSGFFHSRVVLRHVCFCNTSSWLFCTYCKTSPSFWLCWLKWLK